MNRTECENVLIHFDIYSVDLTSFTFASDSVLVPPLTWLLIDDLRCDVISTAETDKRQEGGKNRNKSSAQADTLKGVFLLHCSLHSIKKTFTKYKPSYHNTANTHAHTHTQRNLLTTCKQKMKYLKTVIRHNIWINVLDSLHALVLMTYWLLLTEKSINLFAQVRYLH